MALENMSKEEIKGEGCGGEHMCDCWDVAKGLKQKGSWIMKMITTP